MMFWFWFCLDVGPLKGKRVMMMKNGLNGLVCYPLESAIEWLESNDVLSDE